MRRLDEKAAVVTGAASGIGEATALLFAERRHVVFGDVVAVKPRRLDGADKFQAVLVELTERLIPAVYVIEDSELHDIPPLQLISETGIFR